MLSSMSRQDKPNPALWLATWTGMMGLSCQLGITHSVLLENSILFLYNKCFIDQVCSVKMAGYCSRYFLHVYGGSTLSWSINMQKKNLSNIQPSWPRTWSITHIYYLELLRWSDAFKMFQFSPEFNPKPMCSWASQIPFISNFSSMWNYFQISCHHLNLLIRWTWMCVVNSSVLQCQG